MLTLHDLSVSYGATPVLKSVAGTFPSGRLTALIGPNGSGKSTLLKAIAGLQAHSGRVELASESLDPKVRQGHIAYMPQDTAATSSLTVLEVVLLARIRQLSLKVPAEVVEGAEEELSRYGIADLRGRRLDQISGGQRQLVFLAQALFRQPRVLLLDEPTSALDLRHQLIVLERVRERAARDDIVVIAAIHDVTLAAQFSDDVAFLGEGEIDGYGPPAEIITPERLRRLIGVEAEIFPEDGGRVRIAARRAI